MPRKLNYKPKGILCSECYFAMKIDNSKEIYYCTKFIANNRNQVFKGVHSCEFGTKEKPAELQEV